MRMNGQQNQPIEMSYSERLAEIERKIPIFLDKIQSYDTLFDINEKYKKHIDFLSQQNDSLQNKIDEFKKEQQQTNDNIKSLLSTLRNTVEGLLLKIDKYKTESDDKHKSALETQVMHMRQIDSVSKSMAEIQVKIPSREDIDDVKKINITANDLLKSRVDSLSASIYNIHESLKTRSTKIIDLEAFVKNELALLVGSMNEMQRNQVTARSVIRRLDETMMPAIRNHVSQAFKDIKDIIPEIPPIDSIKKDIQDKMDRIELDGKNAILRATNNEKSVDMMKKQIENIYLLLKKHELSQ